MIEIHWKKKDENVRQTEDILIVKKKKENERKQSSIYPTFAEWGRANYCFYVDNYMSCDAVQYYLAPLKISWSSG